MKRWGRFLLTIGIISIITLVIYFYQKKFTPFVDFDLLLLGSTFAAITSFLASLLDAIGLFEKLFPPKPHIIRVYPNQKLRIFLCHSTDDENQVIDLYNKLKEDNFDPWMDKKNLVGGQNFKYIIEQEVKKCHVFIICISKRALEKIFVKDEIDIALKLARRQPPESVFIIPLKLEEIDDSLIPEDIRRWHWIDYYKEGGYEKLLESLNLRKERNNKLEKIWRKIRNDLTKSIIAINLIWNKQTPLFKRAISFLARVGLFAFIFFIMFMAIKFIPYISQAPKNRPSPTSNLKPTLVTPGPNTTPTFTPTLTLTLTKNIKPLQPITITPSKSVTQKFVTKTLVSSQTKIAKFMENGNIRTGPGTFYTLMDTYHIGKEIQIIGCDVYRRWFVLYLPDGRQGWVNSQLLSFEFDPNILLIVETPPTPTPEPTGVSSRCGTRTTIHPKGDANGDCKVDDSDYSIWKSAYDTKYGDPNYRSGADFNHDRVIDGGDYMIWRNNYGSECTCE